MSNKAENFPRRKPMPKVGPGTIAHLLSFIKSSHSFLGLGAFYISIPGRFHCSSTIDDKRFNMSVYHPKLLKNKREQEDLGIVFR
jgi:hypothetical protein